jgi:hypothetical protein
MTALIPPRARERADPARVLDEADRTLRRLQGTEGSSTSNYRGLKVKWAGAASVYYAAAALSRRADLETGLRVKAYSILFPLRSALESVLLRDLEASRFEDFVTEWSSRSFFGVSAKQGVSIRYALAACVPTRTCAARCYAHDGRDREIHHVFRGALNLFFGLLYEKALEPKRGDLLRALQGAIDFGVRAARADQATADRAGYRRDPRVRFSHVGEMAATPHFTNDLARAITARAPDVRCVIYTRHPMAFLLDQNYLVVNFSLDGPDDPRRRLAPPGARLVAGAWEGRTTDSVDVNFLEHHSGRTAQAVGPGFVCPVTASHGRAIRSCDDAECDRCFSPLRTSHGDGTGQSWRSRLR